jgi:hypothetical protein
MHDQAKRNFPMGGPPQICGFHRRIVMLIAAGDIVGFNNLE